MATNAERRAATRAKLIGVARELFVRDGYANTHTSLILTQAGVSRGALYHHFPSKRDLFEAIFVATSEQAITRARHRVRPDTSPLAELTSACIAWLKEARQPEVASILLDQGPQVLGWKRARELESQFSLAPVISSLERATALGEIDLPSIHLSAKLVNAVLAETALAALHDEPKVPVSDQEATVRRLIKGLV